MEELHRMPVFLSAIRHSAMLLPLRVKRPENSEGSHGCHDSIASHFADQLERERRSSGER